MLLCAFLLVGESWAQTPSGENALVRASNADDLDNFGTSVAIDGDRAVVGAIGESGASELVNRAGAAYVFERSADGTWTEGALLRATAASSRDEFGYSVDIEGDRILIGARQEDGPDDQTGAAGAAYVFERSANGTWTEVAILRASNMGPADEFGCSVSLDGDQAIVGAWQEEGPDDEINGAGAAYIFERSADGTWTETALLRASDAGNSDNFGNAVAIDGDRAIVGAYENADPIRGAGAAYVFERDAGGTWNEVARLQASTPGQYENFGYAVAIEGDRAVVGRPRTSEGMVHVFERDAGGARTERALLQASGATTYRFGDAVSVEQDRVLVGTRWVEALDTGAAYVFEHGADGGWTEVAFLQGSNAENGDQFGSAVAMGGGRAIVGAASEDGASNQMSNVGAAYLFGSSSLPVELTAFHGIARGEAVQLTWETASETNNAGFEVQRRTEQGWEVRSFVEGYGTTSVPQSYRFRDTKPPFADVLVYRLKQVDTDGTASLSPEVVIRPSIRSKVQFAAPFPHPARQHVTVRYVVPDGPVQPVRLDAYNVLGQRIATLVDALQAPGREELAIDTSSWTSGTYILRLQVGAERKIQRLTVLR